MWTYLESDLATQPETNDWTISQIVQDALYTSRQTVSAIKTNAITKVEKVKQSRQIIQTAV